MASRQRPCGSFSVHQKPSAAVPFSFGNIVGYVVQQIKAQLRLGLFQNLNEGFPDKMSDYLAIGKGVVGSTGHCLKVILTVLRENGSTGKPFLGA